MRRLPPTKKKTAAKKKNAREGVLYVTGVETNERAQLEDFAAAVGRPTSWVVRDALRCYIASLEPDVEAFKQKLETLTIEMDAAGATPLHSTRSNSDKRP